MKRMLAAGLAGFELGHRENLEAGIRTLRGIARKHDLIVTGSSDYHGLGKPNQPGENTTDDDMVARIIERAGSFGNKLGKGNDSMIIRDFSHR